MFIAEVGPLAPFAVGGWRHFRTLVLKKERLSHPFLVANVEFGSKQPHPLMPTGFLLLQVGPHQCLTLCLTLLLHLCSR